MMSALTTAQNLLRISIPETTDVTKKSGQFIKWIDRL
jgi:hypothetical protein